MSPARTGIADYSEALVRAMQPLATIHINPASRCDVDLYHLGNNALHSSIYRQALEWPGVAVLHDGVLHHFLLGQLDERAYVEEFVYNYGEWYRDLAAQLWSRRAHSGSDATYFAYPMLRRVAERSRAVVVHNDAAASAVRRHAPAARVTVIPHLLLEPAAEPAGHDIVRLRERFGPGAMLFGVFGHLRESKRVPQVLDAFQAVRAKHPNAWLVIAGDFVSDDLARAVTPLLDRPGVVRLPYLSEPDLWLWVHAVDVCINLRYPSAAESSGIAARFLAIGKCVILTGGEAADSLPEGACLRVDAGLAEREMLTAWLEWLMAEPCRAGEIGELARAHVRSHNDPRAAAARFVEVCRSAR